MDKKPRIAFCFSWQARTLDETYPFFKRNLFDAAKEQWFNYAIFCAVEEDEDSYKVNLLTPTNLVIIKKNDVEKKRIFIDSLFFVKNFRTLRNWWEKRWKQVLHQFFNVSTNFKQINWNDFDLVVRLRFDCFLFNKLNFKAIIEDIKNGDIICNNYVTGSICGTTESRRINDFFFFWSWYSMSVLGEMFWDMETAMKWLERDTKYDFLFNFFNSYKKIAMYIDNKVKFPILPFALIEFLLTKIDNVITPELIYYNYFRNKWLCVKMENFSFILLRKNLNDSIVKLEKKNKYEI